MEVRRGPYVESVHRVSACVAGPDGKVLRSFGDVDRAYPIRSLAKPFIAAELVQSGACEAYGLGDIELALASGSHDGEKDHVSAVRRFLSKIDVGERALLCGPALEGGSVVGPPAQNNCSGKHAAVLAMCRHFSFDIESYIAPDHPIQMLLIPKLLESVNGNGGDGALAIDGCSMPIFGSSLRQIAAAYARFGTSLDPATERVRSAIVAEPAYVGGWSGNMDTQLISWSNGTIIAKIGAEGLHADALMFRGLGIAIKVLDGNSRALPAIIACLLGELGDGSVSSRQLEDYVERPILNASGRRTGTVHAPARADELGGVPMT